MSQPTRTSLNSILLGDELGQIKLVQLNPRHVNNTAINNQHASHGPEQYDSRWKDENIDIEYCADSTTGKYNSATSDIHKDDRHRIVKIFTDCLPQELAASRAITNIRPIESFHETSLDTTDKPNNLFVVSNKVGQLFVCDTDAIKSRMRVCSELESQLALNNVFHEELEDDDEHLSPMLSPIYYNMSDKAPVCGGQPINQTNILVVYQNGDIQHVNVGQDILQSSLKIKRKAIRTLGLGYNSDAKAIHWRIDGSNGICYFDTDASSPLLDENDPITDIVLSSPTHKLCKRRTDKSQQNLYQKSPCIQSRKCNEQDRLVPTHVINMITSKSEYKPGSRMCKWSSITSLNLIYKKLALYDLVGSENFEYRHRKTDRYKVSSYKLNDNRLAVGGYKYTVRIYDVQTQKAIYNCRTGSHKNPLHCPSNGEQQMVSSLDWLGGNKTTRKLPDMLATCSGVDSIVNVYDLRSPKPVFNIDLTLYTENKWQPYENQPRGCIFTSICASGAPYSTAVPSQQLALGSTNGQLHFIDLRYVAKCHRLLGKLAGFCGGEIRELRFVSESFETSKMISCASDRFIRIHKIQTSFTSVISQKLATRVFLGTKPTCIQPVCDEITQSYLASLVTRYGSDSHLSTIDSDNWPHMCLT